MEYSIHMKKKLGKLNHAASSKCKEKPGVIGPCKAVIPKWTFDNGFCRKFDYGGCGENANIFDTRKACEDKCITNKG